MNKLIQPNSIPSADGFAQNPMLGADTGKLIVSYGGGTNSTAMLIGLWKIGIKPDHILFADTGGERQHTYNYIDYFNKWLVKHDMPEIEIVRYKTKHGVELTLEQDVLNNNTLPAIAFGWKTCSQKFKILPQEKFLKERYPGEAIIHLIGYDLGEKRRMKENPLENHTNIFPLIDWEWTRARCVEEILSEKLCLPNKSSCFFCPNMKKHEILDLTEDEKNRVKAMEANAKDKMIELKGLGRQYAWTDLINADESQTKLFEDVDLFLPPCECID
jgi:hypothetical protein